MRIEKHPILGEREETKTVSFFFDGREITGLEGEPVSTALRAAGIRVHRYTEKHHRPRGVFCAIGQCTDCVMVIDGVPNVRSCVTPLKEGMQVQTQQGLKG